MKVLTSEWYETAYGTDYCESQNPTHLFEQIILKCKNLKEFSFEVISHQDLQPVSINHLVSKMSLNLVHLRQLYLPDWYLSENNVRLLTKNIPSLKMVRVHDHMFVSAKVSTSEFNNFIKVSDYFASFIDAERQRIVNTETFRLPTFHWL